MGRTMSEEKPKPIEYEKPEVKDFGDLFELTAGGFIRGNADQLYPQVLRHPNKAFS